MRVLVLGGYGLIGSAVVRQLLAAGHDVTGLGRATSQARLQYPDAEWLTADISRLVSASDWAPILVRSRPDVFVNCAGALQDGARDDVVAVQATAMRALYAAAVAANRPRAVQISAPRADIGRDTAFMRTKGEADAALRTSGLDWTILRPGLVISAQAYGGTALLRALAAMPLMLPMAYPDRLIQTVDVDDVAAAVLAVVEARVPSGQVYDLVEDVPHTLADILLKMRAWLGLPPAREVHLPLALLSATSALADALGRLGWRSPIRSTVVAELAAGVVGDAAPWRQATGASLASLDATLLRLPSTVQERWFARLFLLKPLVIAVLAVFWIVSGLIGLTQFDAAVAVLTSRGTSASLAGLLVAGGAILDLILGSAIVVRAHLQRAAVAMLVVTGLYLLGGAILAPDLWLDPLGPIVKAVLVIPLALVVLAIAEDR